MFSDIILPYKKTLIDFKDLSLTGIYGDVIEEIDWSVGQIIQGLKALGLAENTLIVFTSDYGSWHTFKPRGSYSPHMA